MELARELRNNLHPHPSAHSPYGNSTLSPGSQGLPPDSSVMALFNASATNTRQLLPLLYPTWGLGSHLPRTFLPKQTFFTSCSRCKTVTSSLFPHPRVFPVFQQRLLSPAAHPTSHHYSLFLILFLLFTR